jgi:hypothetical protein
MVVYIYYIYITAAGNSISSHLQAAPGRATGMVRKRQAVQPVLSRTKTHLPGYYPPASQAGRRVGPVL